MKTKELNVLNQLNVEAPKNNTVKLSAVAAAAVEKNKINVLNTVEQKTEDFKIFLDGQYVTYMLAKRFGISDSKIGKNTLPELLNYLGIKPKEEGVNNYSYENTVLLGNAA